KYGNFIDGRWTTLQHNRFSTFNPARGGETVGEYVAADPECVNQAVDAADRAQARWARVPPVERSQLVARFLDAVDVQREALAEAVSLEQGKPIAEAKGECGKALREARFMVGNGLHDFGELIAPQRPAMRNLVLRRPRGVIAAVSPWNFPVLTPMRKIAPA